MVAGRFHSNDLQPLHITSLFIPPEGLYLLTHAKSVLAYYVRPRSPVDGIPTSL